MTDEQIQELSDLLHTIRNATLIADILLRLGKTDLFPTMGEYIHENSQKIIDGYCIKE